MKRRDVPKIESGRLLDLVHDLQWYALRTPPQKEFAAQDILTERGIVTFCPSDRRWRRHSRYTRTKELKSYPLLVRYVFAGFIPGVPAWFDLFSLPIIQGCVGVDGEPSRIDNASMERLIRKYRNGLQRPNEERFMRTHAEFKAGDLVKVCEGPFEGMVVPVIEISDHMAMLQVDFLGTGRRIKIDAYSLEAA